MCLEVYCIVQSIYPSLYIFRIALTIDTLVHDKPDIIILTETKVNTNKAQKNTKKLKYTKRYRNSVIRLLRRTMAIIDRYCRFTLRVYTTNDSFAAK